MVQAFADTHVTHPHSGKGQKHVHSEHKHGLSSLFPYGCGLAEGTMGTWASRHVSTSWFETQQMDDFSKGMFGVPSFSHIRNIKSAFGWWFEEHEVLGDDPNSRMHPGTSSGSL